MEFSRAEVEQALGQVRLSDGDLRERVDSDIIRSLEARMSSLLGAGDASLLAHPERELRFVTRSTLLTYAVIAEIEAGYIEVETSYLLRTIGSGFERVIARDGAVGMISTPRSPRPEFGVSVKLSQSLWDAPYAGFPFYPERASMLRLPRLDIRVPLSVSIGIDRPHRAPNPTHATSTCYAMWRDVIGVIVAGHSVRDCAYGDYVALDSGSAGRFVASGYQPIDAAFLDVGGPRHPLTALPVVPYPTVGDEVAVRTRRGDERRTVAQVNNSLVNPNFSQYPILLYLNAPCQTGDSGALVRLTSTGEGIGIYTGAHEPLEPRAEGALGTAQNLAQAIYTLGVEPMQ